ncbi:MAG: small ribosomal subunit biogenesis GTPase RsgA [Gomphosphaeria aponina SAG 52.96 = DSM 107014]|uniref:Small ribosomal subunit biogenesis GTPase RsgA n=1 Tax=Gomphosphaeria aponina SAG 52.96 = DSM 107014 TaxID=1521640 RepID=A0A941GR76_9CHRO|nr:small ribosomal subunit biogenesis GTPase RsgA [Gomphosphaeria aponina SAG 52.96 = DSM 107014]
MGDGEKEGWRGTVVAVQANFYQVILDETEGKILCTRRSRLKKIGQQVMVGDRVVVEEADNDSERGAIASVLPRLTELERPPVANADQIMLVFALCEPSLDAWQLSRFLVKAEYSSLNLCLVLNKVDLVTKEQQEEWQVRLENWGYHPIFISVVSNWGLEALRSQLKGKITIFAGPSGVGKSSLINKLIPAAAVRVGKVSGRLSRGRHTTRHVELFELPGGGLLADTPGFNQPFLNCEVADLAWCFPEVRGMLDAGNCYFSDCLHRDEPDCVVRGDWERYEHYLKFLEETEANAEVLQQQPLESSSVKLKIKGSGEHFYEPKLESKKYRRSSRRSRHQSISREWDSGSEE